MSTSATWKFGRGELLIEYICWGKFIGRFVFNDDYQFHLTGTVDQGDPPTVSIDGFGDAKDSNGHHYQYFGCVMPLWPHDPRKRPTIVGSVIRAAPKKGSKDRPGGASAFIAIKQNDLPNPDDPQPADTSTTSAPSTSTTTSTVSDPPTAAPAAPSPPAGGAATGGAATGGAGSGPGASSGAAGATGSEPSAAPAAAGADKPPVQPSAAPGAGGYESEAAYRPSRG